MKDKFGLLKGTVFDENRIKNLIPGTLVYKGEPKSGFEVNYIQYYEEGFFAEKFDTADRFVEFYTESNRDNGVNWITVSGLSNIKEIEVMGNYFGLNNLMLEQVLNITKYSSYYYEDSYIFADLQMIFFEGGAVQNENISIYIAGRTVIIFQERANDVLEPLVHRIKSGLGVVRQEGSNYLFYALLDVLVDNYLDVMSYIRLDIMQLEEKIVNEQSLDKRSIHSNRKRLLHFKLAMSAFEKMVLRMKTDSRFHFRHDNSHIKNLESHLHDITNDLLLQQETVNALYENYMLNNSDEMNSVMTTLTLFSAIFIPLSFLTGLFGMNFRYLPGMDSAAAFPYFISACVVMVGGMLTFFKVKKWF